MGGGERGDKKRRGRRRREKGKRGLNRSNRRRRGEGGPGGGEGNVAWKKTCFFVQTGAENPCWGGGLGSGGHPTGRKGMRGPRPPPKGGKGGGGLGPQFGAVFFISGTQGNQKKPRGGPAPPNTGGGGGGDPLGGVQHVCLGCKRQNGTTESRTKENLVHLQTRARTPGGGNPAWAPEKV